MVISAWQTPPEHLKRKIAFKKSPLGLEVLFAKKYNKKKNTMRAGDCALHLFYYKRTFVTHSDSKFHIKPVEHSMIWTLKIKPLGSSTFIVSSWKILLFYSAPSLKIYLNTLLYDKHADALSQEWTNAWTFPSYLPFLLLPPAIIILLLRFIVACALAKEC